MGAGPVSTLRAEGSRRLLFRRRTDLRAAQRFKERFWERAAGFPSARSGQRVSQTKMNVLTSAALAAHVTRVIFSLLNLVKRGLKPFRVGVTEEVGAPAV